MGTTPDIGTALAQMLQQSGGIPSSAQSSQSPMASVLSQAMQHLNTTPFQPTPTGGGGIDPSVHPAIAKVIQTLANSAGAFGWTAMPPQEREARTQMEQQKAETMARLAQAGVAQEQTALWRGEQAETARQRAEAYQRNVESQAEARKTQAQIAQDRLDVQRDMVAVRKAATEGRLQVAHQQLEQRASQFEQTFQLRAKQVGIEQAKLELMEQGNLIKQGFLDVARGALSQRGTVEADQVNAKLQEFQREHWIASSVFGFPDITELTSQSRSAGIPGVPVPATGTAPGAAAVSTPAQAASKPNAPAKTSPKAKSGGGTVIRYDSQGNRVQ